MAKFNYDTYQQYSSKQGSVATENKIGFFQLKSSGDSAIVRFIEDGPESYDVGALHVLGKDNKYRRVSCLRTPYDPIDNCPLCANGEKVQLKMYVKMIRYDTESGIVVEKPCLWERPAGFGKQLNSLIDEYGNLSDCLFKVVRNGSGLDTTYDVLYAPPSKYPQESYTKETASVFDNYSAFGRIVKEYTFDQVDALAHGTTIDQLYTSNKTNSDPVEFGGSAIQNSVKTQALSGDSSTTFNDTKNHADYQPKESSTDMTVKSDRRPWEVPTSKEDQGDKTPIRRRY